MPKRIQRSRAKGSKLPAGVIVVTRPSRFGNPIKIDPRGGNQETTASCRSEAATMFGDIYECGMWDDYGLPSPAEIKRDLAGKDLACWCPLDKPCHADVLLEIANPE